MTGNPLRRILLALTCASAALLAACGSGTIVDPFQPTRVLSVGDSFSDLGQDGKRYRQRRHDQHLERAAGRQLRVASGGVEQGRSFLCPR